MRFEAKNSYFKRVAQTIGNFKNVAKTVAIRHQRRSCYYLANDANLFYGDDTFTGKGNFNLFYMHVPLFQVCTNSL